MSDMDKIPSVDMGKAANAARLELMALCMATYSQTRCDAVQAAIQAALDEDRKQNG